MGSPSHEHSANAHFLASGIAAVINFPLWRASAIAQSGFIVNGSNTFVRYWKSIQPPYRGVAATILGMTWARGTIFYGSEVGKRWLKANNMYNQFTQILPSLLSSTFVQIVNMPLVRATITIQNPSSDLNSVNGALVHIYNTKGIGGLWHGVSAGIMKSVPKYIVAVMVKEAMEDYLPPPEDPNDRTAVLLRSAVKSLAAGIAGAALTNPVDVLRNEMFKTDLSLVKSFRKLMQEEGWSFMSRGLASNMTAVSIPVTVTIFMTDMLSSMEKHSVAL